LCWISSLLTSCFLSPTFLREIVVLAFTAETQWRAFQPWRKALAILLLAFRLFTRARLSLEQSPWPHFENKSKILLHYWPYLSQPTKKRFDSMLPQKLSVFPLRTHLYFYNPNMNTALSMSIILNQIHPYISIVKAITVHF
jgi:hypothetical protein